MRRLFPLVPMAILLVMGLSLTVPVPQAFAQGAGKGASGLPLPRFVSLKAERVNLRVGPGRAYSVAWLYTKPGVPMEIIQEYDNWRRVRDAAGTEGWIFQSLLSGRRTAVAAPWKKTLGDDGFILMQSEPREGANIIAKLEPGVIVTMLECNGEWCKTEAKGVSGWIAQNEIWGAYPGEAFKQ